MGTQTAEYKERLAEEMYVVRNNSIVPNRGPHFHDEFEVTILCSDETDLKYMNNGTITLLKKYSLAFFNNMDIHMLQKETPATCSRCSVHFKPEIVIPFCTSNTNLLSMFFSRLTNAGISCVMQLSLEEAEAYLNLFSKLDLLRNHSVRSDYGVDVNTILVLIQILMMLNRLFIEKNGNVGAPQTSLSNSKYVLVNGIINFIQDNFADVLSLDILCNRFFISKSQINILFRTVIGLTPNQYISIYRLRKAKEMLLKELPIELVCTRSGFNDLSHFSHVFKQHEGLSPKKYQILYRNMHI